MGNWVDLSDKALGLMSLLNEFTQQMESKNPYSLPNLKLGNTIFCWEEFNNITFETLAVDLNLRLAYCQYIIGISYLSLVRGAVFVIFMTRTSRRSELKIITGLEIY